MSNIAVLGSGAWGTALAISFARQSRHAVTLWSHRAEHAEALQAARENSRYLPGCPLPAALAVTASATAALHDAEWIVCAIPSQFLRTTIGAFAATLQESQPVISATKGLETGSHLRITHVLADCLGRPRGCDTIGVLSGPSFAAEVAIGQPTAVTVAFPLLSQAIEAQQALSSQTLRIYSSEDVIGVELGGALKNVIALASGVVTGLGLGHNSIAALITRGNAEMTRLAIANGGKRETMSGLAGLGDLVLTCTGALSRNRHVGMELGRGRKLPEILAGMHGKVAEGIRTTGAALGLSTLCGVEMPITEQVAAVLAERLSPLDAMRGLMSRPGRDE